MSRRTELMEEYPKGCPQPGGYGAFFDWAYAQNAHGLKQKQCKVCGLWLFPQENHPATCTAGETRAGITVGDGR